MSTFIRQRDLRLEINMCTGRVSCYVENISEVWSVCYTKNSIFPTNNMYADPKKEEWKNIATR